MRLVVYVLLAVYDRDCKQVQYKLFEVIASCLQWRLCNAVHWTLVPVRLPSVTSHCALMLIIILLNVTTNYIN